MSNNCNNIFSSVKLRYSDTSGVTPDIINQKQINIRIKKLKCICAPRSLSHVNNTYVVLTILIFQHIQCLHLMYAEVAWVLVFSGTQVQSQIIPDPDYLPDYLSVSYDYAVTECSVILRHKITATKLRAFRAFRYIKFETLIYF